MFDAVAKRYDVTNDVLSLGQDRRWRTHVVDAVAPVAGERILDLAAGTGTSSVPFHDKGATVVPCDFSLGMLQVGKQARPHLPPGGRLVVCEFSHPTWAPFRTVYVEYLMKALPPVARAVSSSPDAYVYLAESIRAWPDQAGLATLLQDAGWSGVEWRNLSGGIVALHRGHA